MKVYRAVEGSGWSSVSGPLDEEFDPGPGWRLATTREVVWHWIFRDRFNYPDIIALVVAISLISSNDWPAWWFVPIWLVALMITTAIKKVTE